MATPGFPLPLRNALAALSIAALDDEAAVAALRWLADPVAPPSPPAAARLAAVHLIDPGGTALLDVHAPHAAGVAAHAQRALAAARHRAAIAPASDALARAAGDAVALWNERLFFEVHEVLEAVWKTAGGAERQALQGVIQIAVAFHHLAHGNLRGAKSLLAEGRARVASVPAAALPRLDLAALLDATAPWEVRLAGASTSFDDPPRLTPRGGA